MPMALMLHVPTTAIVPLVMGGSTALLMGTFFVAMTLAGFVFGRFVGNDRGLLEGVVAGRPAVTDETRSQAKQVLSDLADGGTSEVLFQLIRQVQTPEAAAVLFGGAPLDTLLSLVHDLAKAPKERRAHGDQLLRLLSRIAILSDESTRMRILGQMIKVTPRYRHAVPFLVEICKRLPDAWNDLQPSLEESATDDPAISRYLRDNAGPKEPFVRKATESYMTSMVRFRRMCEERADGMAANVDPALEPIIHREFEFLKIVGAVTRRFVWLPAQVHRFHPLVTDAQVDLLLREAPTGPPEVHAMIGQLAIAWATAGQHSHQVKRLITALEAAARQHPTAGDALLDVFQSLKTQDAGDHHPEREETRRRAYFALLAASDHSFEVIKLLGAHGIPRDLYQSASDRL